MALFGSGARTERDGEDEALFVSFDTSADAFALKACAVAHGLEGRLVPVPRRLSAGCGMAWREPVANRARVEEALAAEGLACGQIAVLQA